MTGHPATHARPAATDYDRRMHRLTGCGMVTIYGTLCDMQKTTVYLNEGELAKLKAMAVREQLKPAALIRKAISAFVDTGDVGLPQGTGKYRSGSRNGSTDRKSILRAAARKGRW